MKPLIRRSTCALLAAGIASAGAAWAQEADTAPARQEAPAQEPPKESPPEQQPPQTTLNFDLLGEEKPGLRVDEAALRQRRTMLTLHQGVGLGMFAIALANTIVGQLNYSDRFASGPSTGKYELAHQITAYATVGAFAVTGLLAVFAPNPIPKTGGFDRVTLHKIAMATAAAGMAAQVVLGIWTAGLRPAHQRRREFLHARDRDVSAPSLHREERADDLPAISSDERIVQRLPQSRHLQRAAAAPRRSVAPPRGPASSRP